MNLKVKLDGREFGELTVIERSPRRTKGHGTYWVCDCQCGRRLIVRLDALTDGKTSRCSICHGRGGRQSVFVEEGDIHGVV